MMLGQRVAPRLYARHFASAITKRRPHGEQVGENDLITLNSGSW